MAAGKEKAVLKGHRYGVGSLAFSPDGKTLATGGREDDNAVRLWDFATGSVKSTFWWSTSCGVVSVAFSPDGSTLAAGAGCVTLWDVHTGRQKAELRWDGSAVSSVAFSPDGKLLASGSLDRVVRLWEMPAARKAGK